MQRPRLPLTFGRGLDRATGSSEVVPSTFADIRNFYARDAKQALRPGLSTSLFPIFTTETDVIGIFLLAATKDVIFVTFDRSSRDVKVWRGNPISVPTLQSVGTWGNLAAGAQLPKVVAAELNGQLALAHDEETISARLVTKVYTPDAVDANVGTMANLQADLDGSGAAADVFFRGVYTYNDSVWGWGWGNELDAASKNRPEIIHWSKPGTLTFLAEGYAICGAKADAIIGVVAVGQILAIRKQATGYRIEGTDPSTYAVWQADALFGADAARLCIAVGKDAFCWSSNGPRQLLADGSSVDIGIDLELDGPYPPTRVAGGVTRNGFVVWENDLKLLRWVFPDIVGPTVPTLEYMLSLRDPQNPRWTYSELKQAVYTAGAMLTEKAVATPPTAYASGVDAIDAGINSGDNSKRLVTLSWTNNSFRGDEFVQVLRRVNGTGSAGWSVILTTPIGASLQSVQLSDAAPVQKYDYAIRMFREGAVTLGYEQQSPDDWTAATQAGSKASAKTTTAQTPVMTAGVWSRLDASHTQVALSWTLQDTQAPQLLQRSNDNAAWTDIVRLTANERSYNYDLPGADLANTRYFRVRADRLSPAVSGPNAVSLQRFMGPAGTCILTDWGVCSTGAGIQRDGLLILQNDILTNDWIDAEIAPDGVSAFTKIQNLASVNIFPIKAFPGEMNFWASVKFLDFTTAASPRVRLRPGKESFGVVDWGDWVTTLIPVSGVPASAETYTPSFTAPGLRFDVTGTLVIVNISNMVAGGNADLWSFIMQARASGGPPPPDVYRVGLTLGEGSIGVDVLTGFPFLPGRTLTVLVLARGGTGSRWLNTTHGGVPAFFSYAVGTIENL